jgi:hypothetical protein
VFGFVKEAFGGYTVVSSCLFNGGSRRELYAAYHAKKFSFRVVRTRKEHVCTGCGCVIKAGSQVYAKTEEVQRWLNRSENVKQHITKYWCGGCKKVESV